MELPTIITEAGLYETESGNLVDIKSYDEKTMSWKGFATIVITEGEEVHGASVSYFSDGTTLDRIPRIIRKLT